MRPQWVKYSSETCSPLTSISAHLHATQEPNLKCLVERSVVSIVVINNTNCTLGEWVDTPAKQEKNLVLPQKT